MRALWGGGYHIKSALPVFEGLLVQAQKHPSSNPVQADPKPIPWFLRLKEVEEHLHRGVVPKVVAQDLKRPDEGPGVGVELAGRDVQLHHQLFLEEGEGESQPQPFEDRGVNKNEGHPIGGPVVSANGHPSGRDADSDVEVVFPVYGTRGFVRVVAQK